MAFAIGMETEKQQERGVQGRYRKVAVGCWFTSTGKAIPKMIKYEDDQGCLRTLQEIRVLKSDCKYYAGIQSRKYDCQTVINGREWCFSLLYHPDENTWDMVVPEQYC